MTKHIHACITCFYLNTSEYISETRFLHSDIIRLQHYQIEMIEFLPVLGCEIRIILIMHEFRKFKLKLCVSNQIRILYI